jgi:hypothetical protein
MLLQCKRLSPSTLRFTLHYIFNYVFCSILCLLAFLTSMALHLICDPLILRSTDVLAQIIDPGSKTGRFSALLTKATSPYDVGALIRQVAEGESWQLRYLVGPDAVSLIKWRDAHDQFRRARRRRKHLRLFDNDDHKGKPSKSMTVQGGRASLGFCSARGGASGETGEPASQGLGKLDQLV